MKHLQKRPDPPKVGPVRAGPGQPQHHEAKDGDQLFVFTVTDTAGLDQQFLVGFATHDRVWVTLENPQGDGVSVYASGVVRDQVNLPQFACFWIEACGSDCAFFLSQPADDSFVGQFAHAPAYALKFEHLRHGRRRESEIQ
jgi:hypothetical protein